MGNNEWLDIDVLDDYLEGKLDAGTMHKVERISLEDPFVAQALAGLTEAKKRTQTLSILQKQLQERVAEKPAERKMWRLVSHRLSIAATAAVLFITVSLLFWMRESQRRQQAELAANNKTVEIELKPKVAAVLPVDTLVKSNSVTLLDQKKVAQVLDKTLTKSGEAVAKNNTVKSEALGSAILQDKQFRTAKLKQENYDKQPTVIGPLKAAPTSPVEMLESRVDGIQVQYSDAKQVKGVVLDPLGRPLPGVDVKMVGNDLRAITNVSGEFTLPVNKDSNKVTLEVASLGFSKKNIEANANEKLNIRLEASNNTLSEVVVVSSDEARKKSAMASTVPTFNAPKDGWAAYQTYLITNRKFFGKSNLLVELSFSINSDGLPTNIKVVRGQNEELDKEAIRLLQEGPKWEYSPKLNNKGILSIKF